MPTSPFEKLRQSWAVTVDDRLLPGAGSYSEGAVAVVMPDEIGAKAWLASPATGIPRDIGRVGVTPVGDPWTFMRRAAGEGLGAIESPGICSYPERFLFMVRVEEAGSQLPTVLTSITQEGWAESLTRTGRKAIDHGELLHWTRFDILDRVSGRWGQTVPFRNWDQGQPLFELRSEGVVVLLAEVPLLGKWISPAGAFAFFTSEDLARAYHQHLLGDGRNQMLADAKIRCEPAELMARLLPHRVVDLRARLKELAQKASLASWCVNPANHREDSACGTTAPRDAPDKKIHRMVSAAGIWKVMPRNVFKLEVPMAPWTGTDTVRWSGGQSVQLLPLDRGFVRDPGFSGFELDADLTETEAEEVVAAQLEAALLETTTKNLTVENLRPDDRLDQFNIICWDAATKRYPSCPWRFPGFLAALRHLAAYEREHDSRWRREGAVSAQQVGAAGSGDSDFERLRSSRFQIGLRRLALRALRRGYRPTDAADLVALCNGTLTTLHVDLAGFAKDILWAASPDDAPRLQSALDVDEPNWRQWEASAVLSVDPVGEKRVVERIGVAAWKSLTPKSRHFLATALTHLAEQGHAPQLDYAPISVEVVKALEVELGAVFAEFRRARTGKTVAQGPTRDDAVLHGYLTGKSQLTLGSLAYLLGAPKKGASELRLALHHFLAALPNGDFLTRDDFVKRGLNKVIHKFRNGGAHDSPISEATCRDCVETLVGTLASPGYIPRVASWRSDGADVADTAVANVETVTDRWRAGSREILPQFQGLHRLLDSLPIEDMIEGGPANVGTDDLVLAIQIPAGKNHNGPTITVGPRVIFLRVHRADFTSEWGRCHPSDPRLGDPPGSRAIWVAFLNSQSKPVYATRIVSLPRG